MVQKFMTVVAGRDSLKTATVTSTGVAQAGEVVALDPSGKLDDSLMPISIAPDVKIAISSENLTSGDYVNIYNNAGVTTVRKADASNDRPCHGFVKATTISGANAKVYFEGANTDLAGLTAGTRMYLSTVGQASATPATVGLHQYLGIAISATEVNTDIADAIVIL